MENPELFILLKYGFNTFERIKGVEPSYLVWKTSTLPMSYIHILSRWVESNHLVHVPRTCALPVGHTKIWLGNDELNVSERL